MKKARMEIYVIGFIIVIILTALLVVLLWDWLGVWGVQQAENISGGLDVTGLV